MQSSLHQTSSDSEHSIRVHPQAIYAPAAPPSFTAMPILGVPPRHQMHAQQHQQQVQPQRIFNAYDHQRVGSFRSRLKKQHPISCTDQNDTSGSTTNNITVDIERHSQREISAPFPYLSSSPSHFFIPLQPCYQLACKVSFTNFQLVCRYFLLFLYYACSMNHIFSRSDGINHHTLSSHFTSALASEIWPRKQFHLFLSIALCYFNPQ